MFFKLIVRQAQRARQENGIYFLTLVTAVAAFYIILSLENQAVFRFLRGFENAALDKMLSYLPLLYIFTLFLLFILVLFANSYQIDRRSREFGVYLLLGMRHGRLWLMLWAEALITTTFTLIAGIAAGLLLSELISLVTARLIGQGIIGHQFSFSLEASLYTLVGYVSIQLLALFFSTIRIFRPEVKKLLDGQVTAKQKTRSKQTNNILFIFGCIILLTAYWFAIVGFEEASFTKLAVAMPLGIIGTIAVIRGATALLNRQSTRSSNNTTQGLEIFTRRQIQEGITARSTNITAASLLLMVAMVSLSEGASIIISASDNLNSPSAVYDFTVVAYDQEENAEIKNVLTQAESDGKLVHLNPLVEAHTSAEFDFTPFKECLIAGLPRDLQARYSHPSLNISLSPDQLPKEYVLNLIRRDELGVRLIPISAYNRLLQAAGEQTITLAENQMIYYTHPSIQNEQLNQELEEAQHEDITLLYFDGRPIEIMPHALQKDLVTDIAIVSFTALIVNDQIFERYTEADLRSIYWNFKLPEAVIDEKGLMLASEEMSMMLSEHNFAFESFLNTFGRQLFYIASGSFIFVYLAVVFLIIACTVIGLQFLTQLKQNNRRYQTLLFLGAKPKQINRSVRQQVKWTFLTPLIPAIISAAVAIRSMNQLFSLEVDFVTINWQSYMIIVTMVLILLGILFGYAYLIYRASKQDVQKQLYQTH